jgi:hypothetical protein
MVPVWRQPGPPVPRPLSLADALSVAVPLSLAEPLLLPELPPLLLPELLPLLLPIRSGAALGEPCQ